MAPQVRKLLRRRDRQKHRLDRDQSEDEGSSLAVNSATTLAQAGLRLCGYNRESERAARNKKGSLTSREPKTYFA